MVKKIMQENKIIEYSWWGKENPPPKHLKTKKQLAEIGLKPKQAVGVIYTEKYDLYLYDPQDSNSVAPKKKATKKQLEALAKGRETAEKNRFYRHWCQETGRHLEAGRIAIEWAKKVLKNKDKWVILDTETTGLLRVNSYK